MQPTLRIDPVLDYTVDIRLKKIRHIYFKIDPVNQRILISAPDQITQQQLNLALASKRQWIEKKIQKADSTLIESADSFFTRRHVQLFGKPLDIKVQPARIKTTVFLSDESHSLRVMTSKPQDHPHINARIQAFLDQALKDRISALITRWSPRLGVTVNEFRLRRMKTRWGSCNITAKRIWLNRVLVHPEPRILEYVVVHELMHLLEPRHNRRFNALMTRHLPDWPGIKARMAAIRL